MRRWPLIILGSFLLFACGKSRVTPIAGQYPYFKLNVWLSQESKRLQLEGSAVERHLQTDGEQGVAATDSLNWEDWFKPLAECDLSKPAFHGFYQVDTLLFGDTMNVQYSALKPDALVRQLSISFIRGNPVGIDATKEVENLLYSSRSEIRYRKDSLYQVSHWQRTRFFDDHYFRAQYHVGRKP